MSAAEEYINYAVREIADARRRGASFLYWSYASSAATFLMIFTGAASLITGAARTGGDSFFANPSLDLRAILRGYPTLTIFLWSVSPASSPGSPGVANLVWTLCWLLCILGFSTLGKRFRSRSAQLRRNADEAERQLPLQSALLRALENSASDINADAGQALRSTHNVLYPGNGTLWWLAPLVSIAGGAIVYWFTRNPL